MYTHESFQKKIDELFPNEKITILEFNGVLKPLLFRCELCGQITRLVQGQSLNRKGKQFACMHCHNSKSNIQQDYKHKIQYLIEKNETIEIIRPFTKVSEDMTFKCLKCGSEFKRKPNAFLETQKCPYCETRSKNKPLSVLQQDLYNLYGNDYEILDGYVDAYTKMRVRHRCGFIYSTTPHNLLTGKQCPRCSKKVSKGERAIKKFLEQHHVLFEFQSQLKTEQHILYFDFFLPDYNLFIEFQGEQHFHPIKYFGGENRFIRQCANDQYKRDWCQMNNFKLLEIAYTDLEQVPTILSTELKLND